MLIVTVSVWTIRNNDVISHISKSSPAQKQRLCIPDMSSAIWYQRCRSDFPPMHSTSSAVNHLTLFYVVASLPVFMLCRWDVTRTDQRQPETRSRVELIVHQNTGERAPHTHTHTQPLQPDLSHHCHPAELSEQWVTMKSFGKHSAVLIHQWWTEVLSPAGCGDLWPQLDLSLPA